MTKFILLALVAGAEITDFQTAEIPKKKQVVVKGPTKAECVEMMKQCEGRVETPAHKRHCGFVHAECDKVLSGSSPR